MDATKKRKIDENGLVSSDSDAAVPNLTSEDARKMIENFTLDQLLNILQDAVAQYPGVLDAVRSIADGDITQRKLFIRGLGWETTSENLISLFSQYGELEEAVVITDKGTGKNKGYGFVTFKHVDGALIALREPSKKIDGRVTVTQLAAAGKSTAGNGNPASDASMRKIYVANVPFDMPADKLLAVFSSYGEIEEGPLGFDKQTGKSKGFALFVYKTPEGAQFALADPVKTIDGRQLNCKLADGKKKTGGPGGVPTGVQAPSEANGDGMRMAPPSMPGSVTGHYGGAVGPGSLGSYGFQGPPQIGHHPNSSLGGQQPSSLGSSGGYGAGLGGPYGYNGPAGYGASGGTAFAGAGGGGSGLGSVGVGFGAVSDGLGSSGPGSSLYRGPSGMHSGGYPDSSHYTSTTYPSQHHQSIGSSPAQKIPPSGMYPNVPPYYSDAC